MSAPDNTQPPFLIYTVLLHIGSLLGDIFHVRMITFMRVYIYQINLCNHIQQVATFFYFRDMMYDKSPWQAEMVDQSTTHVTTSNNPSNCNTVGRAVTFFYFNFFMASFQQWTCCSIPDKGHLISSSSCLRLRTGGGLRTFVTRSWPELPWSYQNLKRTSINQMK